MKIKSFYLPTETRHRLTAEANRQRVSEAEIVRQSLDATLPKLTLGDMPTAAPDPTTQAMEISFRGQSLSLTQLAKMLGTSPAYLSVYQKKGRVYDAIKRFANVPSPPLTGVEQLDLADSINAAYRQKLLED